MGFSEELNGKTVEVSANDLIMAGAIACSKVTEKNPLVAILADEFSEICAIMTHLIMTEEGLARVCAEVEEVEKEDKEVEIDYDNTEG